MSPKSPSFQFYPKDWRSDPNLSRCSKAAKGVWMDILCLLAECEEIGVFISGDKPWLDQEIAAAIGGDISENLSCIQELCGKGVARRNNRGALFSSRMVRDEQKRQQWRVQKVDQRLKKETKTDVRRVVRDLSATCPSLSSSSSSKLLDSSSLLNDKDSQNLVDPPEKPDGPTPEHLFQLWNSTADNALSRVSALTEKRKEKCRLRLREHPEQEFWREVLKKLNASAFLKGSSGWKATFDWLISNDTVAVRVFEGGYENAKSGYRR